MKLDPDDDTIRDALRALEATTPSDYFDELPRRIEARMQADAVPRDENSGLHDIKELAKSQKTRISRRQTSQHDIDDSLLASSQSGLHAAVALPDPAKMISLPSVEEARALAQSAAHAVDVEGAPIAVAPARKRGGVPAWALAGGGVALAAAAVIAVMVMNGGSKSAEPKQAAAPTEAQREEAPPPQAAAGADQAAATGTASGSGSAATVTALPTPAVEPLPPDEGVTTNGIADEEALKAEATAVKRKERDKSTKSGGATADKTDKAEDSNQTEKTVKTDTGTKTDKKTDKGSGGAAGGGKEKLDGAVLGEGDKDELGIGDVMKGGGDKEEAPKKTELTSKEMRAGLAKIEGKAKACYDGTNSGTVKVKLTIEPSGSVTKASASGDLAGTPSGDCVVAAVKSASFPAWEGAPQSTTFVVLLSD